MEWTTQQLQDALAQDKPVTIVDVREDWEWDLCHIEGSVHVPLSDIPEWMAEFDKTRTLVLVCHRGGRSLQAARYLQSQGIPQVVSLRGGVDCWAADVEPEMERY